MSVKADEKIIMKKENLKELNDKFTTHSNLSRHDFILLEWNYTRWDYDTDEVVEIIVDYLHMLADNNIPCRYIAIYDVGTEDEIKSYGSDEYIVFIEGCMYVSREIKVSDYFYDM